MWLNNSVYLEWGLAVGTDYVGMVDDTVDDSLKGNHRSLPV